MKAVLTLLCILLVSPAALLAQTAKKAAAHGRPMSFAFTTAALKALRLIDSYEGDDNDPTPEVRELLAAMENAEDVARSQGEGESLQVLHSYLQDKLDNNLERNSEVISAQTDWTLAHPGANSEWREQALPAVAHLALDKEKFKAMNQREKACRLAIDRMLRSGSFYWPSHCGDVSQLVK